jgi:TetR/AcrR family transcriptional repressor of nem operon
MELKILNNFFYESVRSFAQEDNQKGCFVTNTQNEFLEIEDSVMTEQMTSFRNILKI